MACWPLAPGYNENATSRPGRCPAGGAWPGHQKVMGLSPRQAHTRVLDSQAAAGGPGHPTSHHPGGQLTDGSPWRCPSRVSAPGTWSEALGAVPGPVRRVSAGGERGSPRVRHLDRLGGVGHFPVLTAPKFLLGVRDLGEGRARGRGWDSCWVSVSRSPPRPRVTQTSGSGESPPTTTPAPPVLPSRPSSEDTSSRRPTQTICLRPAGSLLTSCTYQSQEWGPPLLWSPTSRQDHSRLPAGGAPVQGSGQAGGA